MNEAMEYIEAADALLIGVFHDGSAAGAERMPAVVFWNVGVSNRVGAQRQYVDMARELSTRGFSVLRFDLGGLGDSVASTATRRREDQELAEIQAALNHLERCHGFNKFILVGFCSSAANAHPTMVRDERVVGAILIDGYGYKTFKFHLLHVWRRLFSLEHWWSRVGRIARLFQKAGDAKAAFFFDFPERTKTEREILAAVQRGTRIFYIYSGGIQSYYNYNDQFWDMFPLLKSVSHAIKVKYMCGSNHLFMYEQNKKELKSEVISWIEAGFGS